ncbi:MAG: HAMP domain-containing protein [Amphritea sp.]|nr:HAMP domain-containing protein [Amphritea sp.]
MISLLIATLPLVLITLSYDRFTGQLLDNIEEQKARYSLNSSYLGVMGFLRNRQYELSTVIDLPGIEGLLDSGPDSKVPDNIYSLIDFETDSPHIYGVLFFDRDWNLLRALPGQGAAGFPYRGEGHFDISRLPRVELGEFVLIGPQVPTRGASGWFLLALPLNPPVMNQPSPGYAVLHLRLASITELLKPFGLTESIEPFLVTPSGNSFSLLGESVAITDEALVSEDIAPGWIITGIRTGELASFAKELTRPLFITGVSLSIVLVIIFFLNISFRITKRILPLIHGADTIAKGNLNHRIVPTGNDEITLLAKTFNSMGKQLQELIDSRISVEKRAVMGEFSAGIAHEIRNPLATMKVCVQGLSAGKHDPHSREQLTMILEEIDRINEVIEGLLHYARPMEPRLEWLSVASLFHRIESLAGPLAANSSVELSVETEQEIEIFADTNQLQQVLMNLILNAIQAMPLGGALSLKSYRKSGLVVLEIKDSGQGMSQEQVDKATQPFYTTKSEGTGLGLAISARLIHLNSGGLSISSTQGEGTTVTLLFEQMRECHE